jgi:predicted DCC family thiol-disulfide oxidoreductase YuxK
MRNNPIILFDGVCNFCNSSVNFVIERDKKSIIKFAPLQSEAGQQLLQQYNLSTTEFNSFVFIEAGNFYTASTAALKVTRYLSALWPLLYGFIIVPKFIRDGVYNWISKNRYKWFGKKEQCMIPTLEIRSRFL